MADFHDGMSSLVNWSLALSTDMFSTKVLSLLALAGAAVSGGSYSAAPTVKVQNGTYSGVHNEHYNQDFFLGVPYAQKQVRYTLPASLNTTWTDTRPATTYPPLRRASADPRAIAP